MLAFLRDLVDQASREIVPIDVALADSHQFHTDATQRRDPFARLDRIEPAKPILIPAENGFEVAPRFSVADHASEFRTLVGPGSADPMVLVPAKNAVAVAFGQFDDLGALLLRAVLLLVGAHADVAHGGLQSRAHVIPSFRVDGVL